MHTHTMVTIIFPYLPTSPPYRPNTINEKNNLKLKMSTHPTIFDLSTQDKKLKFKYCTHPFWVQERREKKNLQSPEREREREKEWPQEENLELCTDKHPHFRSIPLSVCSSFHYLHSFFFRNISFLLSFSFCLLRVFTPFHLDF